MKKLFFILIVLLIISCNGDSSGNNTSPVSSEQNENIADNGTVIDNSTYHLHENITSTVFWIGEKANEDNKMISNIASAWDDMWMQNYGGIDDPNNRNGYMPEGFVPLENPFYVALPFNDFDENGKRKQNLYFIYWYSEFFKKKAGEELSLCKNRWVKIIKNNKEVYAQWEDAGPFGENDYQYVFGKNPPANNINDNAGIDVSPAIRDYLNLNDIDKVNWQFVNASDVPDGDWKLIVTTSNVNWVDWFKPNLNTTWQWQLQGKINTSYNVNVYDIDLFDTDQNIIDELHNKGRKVICYFSAGSYEDWRSDAEQFPLEALGKNLDNWEGEKWLDIRNDKVKEIMKSRLNIAVQKKCDGVEPDNVDGYANDTGLDLTYKEQLEYNKFLAMEAHKRGLSIGLKNDLEQIKELEPFFDFAVNEQCFEYDECDLLLPFINSNKSVLNVEYNTKYIEDENARSNLCASGKSLHFYTLILPLELDDSFRYSCE